MNAMIDPVHDGASQQLVRGMGRVMATVIDLGIRFDQEVSRLQSISQFSKCLASSREVILGQGSMKCSDVHSDRAAISNHSLG